MSGRGGRSKRMGTNEVDSEMADRLDELSEFETFQARVLPKLRALISKPNPTAEEILEFSKAFAVAKIATIAFTDADSSRALAAAKDLIDRSIGKAKERSEVEHRFAKLQEQELDALIESRLSEAAEDAAAKPEQH